MPPKALGVRVDAGLTPHPVGTAVIRSASVRIYTVIDITLNGSSTG